MCIRVGITIWRSQIPSKNQFFGGIPATGAIAGTAMSFRSGSKTRLSGVIRGGRINCWRCFIYQTDERFEFGEDCRNQKN
ncbi:SulP family inorganic anion transporter [Aphanizomenon sp. CS-733/32]|uniref:SulP family inorganic anion transporter n=1 Tax=Aphanizomenon sp. CS-733/32 TaxID=3021715 RepID=UPI00232DA534|nr:SulP family inorganic anion transporter [Aphanizomenon sp. CS-733/32]MDB9308672.1 SulP family inorganic anion transporter [Aphanizomenon sp. CS-733/32]